VERRTSIAEDGSDEAEDLWASMTVRRVRMHRSREKGALALLPFADNCPTWQRGTRSPTQNSEQGNAITAIRPTLASLLLADLPWQAQAESGQGEITAGRGAWQTIVKGSEERRPKERNLIIHVR
jgi:hypothetical protein